MPRSNVMSEVQPETIEQIEVLKREVTVLQQTCADYESQLLRLKQEQATIMFTEQSAEPVRMKHVEPEDVKNPFSEGEVSRTTSPIPLDSSDIELVQELNRYKEQVQQLESQVKQLRQTCKEQESQIQILKQQQELAVANTDKQKDERRGEIDKKVKQLAA